MNVLRFKKTLKTRPEGQGWCSYHNSEPRSQTLWTSQHINNFPIEIPQKYPQHLQNNPLTETI